MVKPIQVLRFHASFVNKNTDLWSRNTNTKPRKTSCYFIMQFHDINPPWISVLRTFFRYSRIGIRFEFWIEHWISDWYSIGFLYIRSIFLFRSALQSWNSWGKAPFGIMGDTIKGPLKPPEHHDNMAPKCLREALNSATIVPRDASLTSMRKTQPRELGYL